jgi:hypothetical protein
VRIITRPFVTNENQLSWSIQPISRYNHCHPLTFMSCACANSIRTLISSDRDYLRNCIYVLSFLVVFSGGLVLCLRLFIFKGTIVSSLYSLTGLLANGIGFPLIPKCLQTRRRLVILQGMNEDSKSREKSDPECERIANNVDALLRAGGTL